MSLSSESQFIPAELIKKKRAGLHHTADELAFLINSYSKNLLPDYQMAAWLMAVCFQGMSLEETAQLTSLMKNSGESLSLSHLNRPRVDKHSTGGVGDKTSLIVAPLAACAGLLVPMIAGRGLGHTGGTLDKLESISGFNVRLTRDRFIANLKEIGVAIMGQTEQICPADRKLYSLRDVTGTVDSLPLICGSIMSKKLAEDLTGLVLDVKFGSGAFMKTPDQAEALARLLKTTGELNGLKVTAFLTNMDQPLGRYAGNSLEVEECLAIMSNDQSHPLYEETRELSLQLAAEMLVLGGVTSDFSAAYKQVTTYLTNGSALKKFKEICRCQGANDISIARSKISLVISAPKSGYIKAYNTEAIGLATVELGVGRKAAEDSVDPLAGIEFFKKIGQKIEKGEPLFQLFASNDHFFEVVQSMLLRSVEISELPSHDKMPLIGKKL